MRKVHTGRRPPLAVMALAAVLAAASWPSAQAVSFQSESGNWTGSWDTTIGYGQAWRVSGLDCRLVAIANGGCGYSPNIDDGDLNYRKNAAFSEALTGTSELALNYRDGGGIFVRGSGLYDWKVMGDTNSHVQFTHDAKGVIGSYTRLLDAFGFLRFDLGTMPSEMRLGRQVVDWGESTFIPNGLNEVNHFDVTALQVPGAELKQALLPDEMAVFDRHEDIIEPDGAYFSTNDFAGPGGNHVFLGFGAISDQGADFGPLGGPLISDFQAVNRLADHKPLQSGQFGINFKLYLPNFSQGTQLGVYFLNYTSRLPVVSAQTGTQAGLGNAFGAVNAVGAAAQALAAGLPFQGAAANGGNLSAATAQQYATIGANTLLAGGNVNNQASNIATYEYGKTAGLYESFPQDIKMLGVSFNTQIQKTGTALQGEVAFRHDVPLQLGSVELLYATLAPFEAGITRLLGGPVTPPGTCVPTSPTPITGCNQFGLYGLGQSILGFELKNTWHADITATQVFANVLKASQAVLVLEAGADYVPGLESLTSGGPVGRGLEYDAPGAALSGQPALGGYPEFPGLTTPLSEFPTKFSWGYVIAGRLEYNNVIGALNLLPHATWAHDVTGVSPGPGGNFIAGRHAITA